MAVRLARRFGELTETLQLVDWIGSLEVEGGGYGVKANLWDTCACLDILSALGRLGEAGDTRDFVDRRQVPPFGFALTADLMMENLEVVCAGAQCCALLSLPVRHPSLALSLVVACQTSNGGFSRAPVALPDLKLTHRAIQIVSLIAPEILT